MKHKKVCGIVTFHRAQNYGAVLQAYALQRVVMSLGWNAVFVDYRNPILERAYSVYPSIFKDSKRQVARKLLNLILDKNRLLSRKNNFNSFVERRLQVQALDDIGHLDALVLGSDQIWNKNYTKGFVKEYFGVFSLFSANRVISYAASMGQSGLAVDDASEFASLIGNIDYLGVREHSLANLIVKNCESRDVEVNLDPTFLLSSYEWYELAEERSVAEEYVLLYEVEPNKAANELADSVALELGVRVVRLTGRSSYKYNADVISDAAPEEFLSLFRYAAFVVTTSFHGTAFSIIFERPFFTVTFGNDTDLRSVELLDSVALTSRLVSGVKNRPSLSLSFVEPSKRLESLRENSVRFLRNGLEGGGE